MKKVLATLAMVAFASISFAEVTFDPSTGGGFIGRGDIISHKELGKEALVTNPRITFGCAGEETWLLSIKKSVGNGNGTQYKDQIWTREIGAATGQTTVKTAKGASANITGYTLVGYTTAGDTGEMPSVNNFLPNVNSGWIVDPNGPYPNPTKVSNTCEDDGLLIFEAEVNGTTLQGVLDWVIPE